MRRVPFQNMVYIADGPSDVPCFSLVSHFGGRTYAVYNARSGKEFQKAYDLQKQQRVEAFGEADYSDGSHTAMWITKAMEAGLTDHVWTLAETVRLAAGEKTKRESG